MRPRPPFVAAVDVGGTSLKGGLVALDGSVHRLTRVHTPRDADEVVDAIGRLVTGLATGGGAVAFGVCTPGIVDPATGVVRAAANLGWHEVPLLERLRRDTGLPGAVAHDMRAAGVAEWRLGAARGVRDLCFSALGTGISAAVVVDGHLLQAGGYAGEIGHLSVAAAAGVRCACGATGCLETVASAVGVRRTAARLRGVELQQEVPTAELARRARDGEVIARAAFDKAAAALAEAFCALTTLVGPERIVIGGGMAEAYDLLVPTVDRALGELPFQRRPHLVRAQLGSNAGLVGAGLIGAEAASLVPPIRGGRP
ncbi:ROK family protein [Mariniluteicoccus endophyticus]